MASLRNTGNANGVSLTVPFKHTYIFSRTRRTKIMEPIDHLLPIVYIFQRVEIS